MAQAQLATKRKQIEGRQQVAAAAVDRESKMHQAQAKADVEQTQAESESKVMVARAKAQNEISLMEATNAAKEQEVKSRMPPQELELKRLELIVEGMRHFGQRQRPRPFWRWRRQTTRVA